jgi:hypothetical protein
MDYELDSLFVSHTTLMGVSHSEYKMALLVGRSKDKSVSNARFRRSIGNKDGDNLRL